MTLTNSASSEHIVIVLGVARSKSARSARQYEQRVRSAASRSFAAPLRERDLCVEIHHFYTSGNPPDLDNLLKAILDGLKSAAYGDDSQVVRVSVERYNVSTTFSVENPRPEWLDLLPPRGEPRDFVSVVISKRG